MADPAGIELVMALAAIVIAAIRPVATLTPPAVRRWHSGRRGADAGARVHTTGQRISGATDEPRSNAVPLGRGSA